MGIFDKGENLLKSLFDSYHTGLVVPGDFKDGVLDTLGIDLTPREVPDDTIVHEDSFGPYDVHINGTTRTVHAEHPFSTRTIGKDFDLSENGVYSPREERVSLSPIAAISRYLVNKFGPLGRALSLITAGVLVTSCSRLIPTKAIPTDTPIPPTAAPSSTYTPHPATLTPYTPRPTDTATSIPPTATRRPIYINTPTLVPTNIVIPSPTLDPTIVMERLREFQYSPLGEMDGNGGINRGDLVSFIKSKLGYNPESLPQRPDITMVLDGITVPAYRYEGIVFPVYVNGEEIIYVPNGLGGLYPNATFVPPTPLPTEVETATPVPSNTPRPTDTPRPTSTLVATATPFQGFLLWPFFSGTPYQRNDYLGRDSVFDRNQSIGAVEPYDPSIPIGCSGSVCVVDNHTGIDIGVAVGTRFNSSADLRITGFETLSGYEGRPVGVIYIDYGNGYTGRYAHAQLLDGFQVGDSVLSCIQFGSVEESDVGASHLHFEILERGRPIDPYDSLNNPIGKSLWSGGANQPQYCP